MLTKLLTNLPWNRRSYVGRHRATPRYLAESDGGDSAGNLLGFMGRK